MVDICSEDLDKITKKVYAKIAEAMAEKGEVSTLRAGECNFGCPSGNAFGCKLNIFTCTGDYFSCSPKYAMVQMP